MNSNSDERNSKPPESEEPVPPHPDFQESKLVPDESEAYEEQQTGIELSYVLKEEEVYECLKASHYFHSARKVFVPAAALLVISLIAALLTGSAATYRGVLPAALCAVFLIVFGVLPRLNYKKRARAAADGRPVRVTVYPDRIEAERGTWRREISLDATVEMAQIEGLFALYLKEKMLIVPMRCITPRVLPDVQAMLAAGTRPKKMPKF